MRRDGYSLREIAKTVGYSHEAVRIILNESRRFAPRVPLRAKPIRKCSLGSCNRKHRAHGYCGAHLARLKAGTMDEKGNALPVHRTCRICKKELWVPARSGQKKMCDECRPRLTGEGTWLKEAERRHKAIRSLHKQGVQIAMIARKVGLSPETVRKLVGRKSTAPSPMKLRIKS